MITPLILILLLSLPLQAKQKQPHMFLSVPAVTAAEPARTANEPTVPKTITMAEAVELAKKHRPNLQALDLQILAAKSKVKEAWGGYLPQVNLSTQLIQEVHQNQLYTSATLGATQLVYSFNGPQMVAAQAKQNVAMTEHEKVIQEHKVRYEVENQFINAWLLQQQQTQIEQIEKSSDLSFRKAEHEEQLALLDKNNWLRSGEQRANAHMQILNFRDNLQVAQRNLTFLLGQSVSIDLTDQVKNSNGTHLVFEGPAQDDLAPLEQYQELALACRPELKKGKSSIEYEHIGEKILNRAYLPTMSIFGHAARLSVDTITAPSEPLGQPGYFDFGANFSWNIFDGAVSHHQAAQAHARKVAATLQLEQQRQEITFQVESAYFEVSRALLALKAQQFAYQRAHNEFVRKEQEKKLGLIADPELEAARNDWYGAQYCWLTLSGQLAQKQAQLRYQCGYPV